ncbi:hypothetical protein EPUS_00267 [Endocarpon pusillum Z07020]|uniref:Uncharacterized protein n=1 Tax=Endocarpon pusillum (strain Z07020 / HMAS-L-300199) TaxID=1263415 RepID=U1HIQ1_ENDPU|nr:uncharacterized protein EPUS_00267 [Endocarpon pusillum Z07020]ERF70080.1 hypothetical protein EPUS_00267 [Endocarpon pusillum Z07020]
MAIQQSSFIGGIAVGVFGTLFILLCYYLMMRFVRRPKVDRTRDLEMGRAAAAQLQAQQMYPAPVHPAHFRP